MISSFHAVFGLRQRDKSAKVIDYNDQVIRVLEHLFLLMFIAGLHGDTPITVLG